MSSPNPDAILDVIKTLLSPSGCPWDQKQTPESLCDYLAEECFELIDAIRSQNILDVQEEMGDVFFLLFFIATLVKEKGLDLNDIWHQNALKMIRRHPHVFDNLNIENNEQLLDNWEKIKKQEKKDSQKSGSTFASLPTSLPPLLKAYRINSKAARIGFTWQEDASVLAKVEEELAEFKEACSLSKTSQIEEELGDVIFSLVELGRRHGVKANSALARTNQKFLRRIETMSRIAQKEGKNFEELEFEEMDELWEKAKTEISHSDNL